MSVFHLKLDIEILRVGGVRKQSYRPYPLGINGLLVVGYLLRSLTLQPFSPLPKKRSWLFSPYKNPPKPESPACPVVPCTNAPTCSSRPASCPSCRATRHRRLRYTARRG